MDYRVDADFEGKSIRDFMKNKLGLSSALCKHLKFIENGITLNGTHATVRAIQTAPALRVGCVPLFGRSILFSFKLEGISYKNVVAAN